MRVVSLLLALVLSASPAMAQQPIRDSVAKAATAVAAQPAEHSGRGRTFWPGLALGIAGATVAVLGTTVYRIEDTSTGNAPESAYQACVAQKSNPVYASNLCDGLKGKNRAMLWGGAAVGALGAALIVIGTDTSAELTRGGVRLVHRLRF